MTSLKEFIKPEQEPTTIQPPFFHDTAYFNEKGQTFTVNKAQGVWRCTLCNSVKCEHVKEVEDYWANKKHFNECAPWAGYEDALLRELRSQDPPVAWYWCGDKLGRSAQAVRARAKKMGVK